MVPPCLTLEVFPGPNRGVVLSVGHVTVEVSLGGAGIHEFARDGDDSLPVVDGHRAGLNNRLAGKIALGGYQRPRAVERAVVASEGGEPAEEGRQDRSGNSGS